MGVFPLTFRGIRGVVVYRIVSSAITATSMARRNGNRRGDRLHPTQIRFPPDHRSFPRLAASPTAHHCGRPGFGGIVWDNLGARH
jgi:hypothetical protein